MATGARCGTGFIVRQGSPAEPPPQSRMIGGVGAPAADEGTRPLRIQAFTVGAVSDMRQLSFDCRRAAVRNSSTESAPPRTARLYVPTVRLLSGKEKVSPATLVPVAVQLQKTLFSIRGLLFEPAAVMGQPFRQSSHTL